MLQCESDPGAQQVREKRERERRGRRERKRRERREADASSKTFFSRFGGTACARLFSLFLTFKRRNTTKPLLSLSLPPTHTGPLGALPGGRARARHPLPAVAARGKEEREKERKEKGRERPGSRRLWGRGGKNSLPPRKKKSPPNSSTQGDRPRRRRLPLRGRLPGRAQGRARRQGVGAGARCFRDSLFFSLFFLASRCWMKEKGKLSPLSSLSRLLVQNEILQKCRETLDRSSTSSAS